MSRIGNKPIPLGKGVSVAVADRHVTVKGPNGSLEMDLPATIDVKTEDNQLVVMRPDDSRQSKALHGLSRSLLNNMVVGVDTGFKKELEIRGVGYRAEVKGKNLVLSLGFSHPVEYPIVDGIKIEVDGKKIAVTHYPEPAETLAGSGAYDVVIYGHTHRAEIRGSKPLVINPGECGGWLEGKSTIVILDLSAMEAELIEL